MSPFIVVCICVLTQKKIYKNKKQKNTSIKQKIMIV